MSSATEAFAADLVAHHKEALVEQRKNRIRGQFTDNVLTADVSPLTHLVSPHIDSFNWIFEPAGGIAHAIATLPTIRIPGNPEAPAGPQQNTIEFRVSSIAVGKPTWSRGSDDSRMLPADARQLGVTYDAPLTLTLQYRVLPSAAPGSAAAATVSAAAASTPWIDMARPSGRLPIMVKSSRCHLNGLSRAELVKAKEEAGEWGGYFIMNGNERCVRLLIMPRRNHITTLIRSSFLSRGAEYTKYATSIRCVRTDHSAITISVHYLETGGVNVRFAIRKQEFFVPAVLILKALTGASDREIYEKLTFGGDTTLAFEAERVELMLRDAKMLGLRSQSDVLAYLGSHFRLIMRADPTTSDAQVGLQLLREYLFIHVQDFDTAATEEAQNQAKFDLLVLMIQRLHLLVQDKITPDHVDALSSHEVLLPGHLYYMILKENIGDFLLALRSNISRELRLAPGRCALGDVAWWRKMSDRIPEIGRKLAYFITTGNLVSRSGLDLMQVSGYTIVAEKLNYYRYLSHFRSIHRGQFFTTMKTTAVRKLLPESWGFVCPVHTPDGTPCGLLNHLAAPCKILTHACPIPAKDTVAALFSLGMRDPYLPARVTDVPIVLDGVLVGRIPRLETADFAARVRFLKVSNHPAFYKHLEIFTVTDFDDKMFPSICLATSPSRFQRPVYYLPTGAVPKPVVEYIGAMEQLTMEIGVTAEDFRVGQTTHQEINPTAMLSVVASLTPFSDHNQSPRNMYQCVSVDHEVLTRNGWCGIAQTAVGDEVMTFDASNGTQAWQRVTDKIDEVCDEPWYRMHSADVDAVVTGPHRWLVNTKDARDSWSMYTTDDFRNNANIKSLTSESTDDAHWENGVHRNHSLPLVGRNANASYSFDDVAFLPESFRADSSAVLDFCRFIGCVVADGGLKQTENVTELAGAAFVEGVLTRLGALVPDVFAFTLAEDGEKKVCRLSSQALYEFVKPMTSSLHYSWRSMLARDQARAVLEGFTKASVRGTSASLCIVNDLSALALLAEGRPTVTKDAEAACWSLVVSFNEEDKTSAVPKPVVFENPADNGRRYCLTVPNGNFLARRKVAWGSDSASQTPFFTGNCQMGKQTMGTPFHSFPYRVDNKVYRIQNPQTPLVRNEGPYQDYLFDEYPMGCNAVVAVISYTGYDMEDAMIINKSAYERGFGHGSVYKYKTYDLTEERTRGEPIHHRFNNLKPGSTARAPVAGNPSLDADGLPRVGQLVNPGEPLAAVHNDLTNTTRMEKFKDTESAYVEEVRALATSDEGELQKVGMWLRMNRNPLIGDKFSSRHGQKGVLSVLFPSVDMPWTESGLTPDVIINPHAFPSRMTIGMLIESMAGKAGALHGRFQDGTPFQFDEQNRAVDYFGQQLRQSGYNYLGSEPLYSGITGEPMIADIFVGLVYYQRLRHMVKDKFQARATGAVSSLHRQPIKGRKRHGGIRFGEMERDSLIAHGVSYFLHDRLMNSSDYHTTYVCQDCGSLLAAHAVPETSGTDGEGSEGANPEASESAVTNVTCRICGSGSGCCVIAIPFSFLYLAHELAAMNIRVTLDVK